MFLKSLENDIHHKSNYQSNIYIGYVISKSNDKIVLDFGLKTTFIFQIENFNKINSLISIGDRCICEIDEQTFIIKYNRSDLLINYNFKNNFNNCNYVNILNQILYFKYTGVSSDINLFNNYCFIKNKSRKNLYGLNFYQIFQIDDLVLNLYPYNFDKKLQITTSIKNYNIILETYINLIEHSIFKVKNFLNFKLYFFIYLYLNLISLKIKLNFINKYRLSYFSKDFYFNYIYLFHLYKFLFKNQIIEYSETSMQSFLNKKFKNFQLINSNQSSIFENKDSFIFYLKSYYNDNTNKFASIY